MKVTLNQNAKNFIRVLKLIWTSTRHMNLGFFFLTMDLGILLNFLKVANVKQKKDYMKHILDMLFD